MIAISEQKYQLTNGVRVLIEPLQHVHSAAIGFWVDAGSVAEKASENGMCHFLEHMLFKGTATRSALELVRGIEATGGSINAFTDKDLTCFYARVPTPDVADALDVLCDMLVAPLLDAKEIRREKAVVIEEIKMYEDDPEDLSFDLLMSAFWANHPIGRPITGTRGTVRAFDRPGLTGFLDRHYTAERLVVAVAGNVEPEAIIAQLEDRLALLRRSGLSRENLPAAPQPGRVVKYRDVEQAHLSLGWPGVTVGDPERYAFALLNSILGGGMASRLFQEVREKRGLCYEIGSSESLYREGGLFSISGSMTPKHLPTALAVIAEELAKLRDDGVTDSELAMAKRQLAGGLAMSLESPRHRMTRLAQNELYYGRSVSPAETLAAVEAVTAEDLRRLAEKVFAVEPVTTVVGPLRKLPQAA